MGEYNSREKTLWEKKQKVAHRIKLKKSLEKAKLKVGNDVFAYPEEQVEDKRDEMKDDKRDDKKVQVKEDDKREEKGEDKRKQQQQRQHHSHKPDPARKALEKAKQVHLQREQAEFERGLKEKQRQKQIKETHKRRRQEKATLFKRTKRGQPVLSNQIAHLLGKIDKN